MEGNRYQFLAIQSWVEQFWTNSDDEFGIDPDESSSFALSFDLVMGVATAFRRLATSFDNFMKAHRRSHSLTGTHVRVATLT